MGLDRRLHVQMLGRREVGGGHESFGQGGIGSVEPAVEADGVVLDRFLAVAAVGLQHLAPVGEREDRLDAARHVAGEQRDGAGRGNRGEERVADARSGDAVANLCGQVADVAGREIGVAVEQREGTLGFRQLDRRQIGGGLDGRHPFPGPGGGGLGTVAQAAHDEGIGEPGHAEADAPLVPRFLALLLEGKERDVDDIVHHAHGGRRGVGQRGGIEPGLGVNGARRSG